MHSLWKYRRMVFFAAFGAELLFIVYFSPLLVAFAALNDVWRGNCVASTWASLFTAPTICVPLLLCALRLNRLVLFEQMKLANMRDAIQTLLVAKSKTKIFRFVLFFAFFCIPAFVAGIHASTPGQVSSEPVCHYPLLIVINGIYGVCMCLAMMGIYFLLRHKEEHLGVMKKMREIMYYSLPLLLVWIGIRQVTGNAWGVLPVVIGLFIFEVHTVVMPVQKFTKKQKSRFFLGMAMSEVVTRDSTATPTLKAKELHEDSDSHVSEGSAVEGGSGSKKNVVFAEEKIKDSLPKLMESPVFEKYFAAFLAREFATENLVFWKEVNEFSKNLSVKEAKHIISVFVLESGVMAVNISAKARKKVLAEMVEIEALSEQMEINQRLKNLFSRPLLEVQNLLVYTYTHRFTTKKKKNTGI
eukprot:TRINITY_DN1910_c0_g1_i1.p1 TRINITY_DN1910_c0_g1~~TRINITY_DN1910_c0_g1_i1.p1  ORF type:complete len:439 (+),score=110.85 TRINITY_DN1910_c0_g1_i1:79-1317(+)